MIIGMGMGENVSLNSYKEQTPLSLSLKRSNKCKRFLNFNSRKCVGFQIYGTVLQYHASFSHFYASTKTITKGHLLKNLNGILKTKIPNQSYMQS